ncbi:2,5-didehydrogluconate reductase B [Chromobacterium amazonense]|uniref:2,5-didehydrogluconate reductase B n=1 Tax=Chromobacterium amazonense TaxID=1382803 RepID=A0A2S9X8P1_9NEIS|nr:2,5-didehydrogluconate reductase DkgB [Chromobacterium amazonense]KIA80946.1 aldo/keto reductase [Chromobacterium piscinae]PRP72084.1 2,5-didehydrogluconate reductase B [Chromobacterium amazonense]
MQMPKLGAGTFRLKEQQAEDAVAMALELGYRHIDTAQIYRNEADVGRAIANSGLPRGELYVTTKIWTDQFAQGKLIPSLRASLDKLGLEQVDMTLIHWPSPKDEVPMAVYMEQLAEAKQLGLTREIGVSNFTIKHLEQAIAVVGADAIATHQLEVHPYLQNLKVRAFCRQHGIALTGYMPLAYGRVIQDPVLQDIARKHGATAAQVALAWQLQQDIAVIPSSTKHANLAANLKALTLRLDDADMARIAKLEDGGRIADPDFAPAWDA